MDAIPCTSCGCGTPRAAAVSNGEVIPIMLSGMREMWSGTEGGTPASVRTA